MKSTARKTISKLSLSLYAFASLPETGLIRRKAVAANMETEIDRLDIGRLTLITIPGEVLGIAGWVCGEGDGGEVGGREVIPDGN